MEHQGSSTDEEDCCVQDDATIAGPTNRSSTRQQQQQQQPSSANTQQQRQQSPALASLELLFSNQQQQQEQQQQQPAKQDKKSNKKELAECLSKNKSNQQRMDNRQTLGVERQRQESMLARKRAEEEAIQADVHGGSSESVKRIDQWLDESMKQQVVGNQRRMLEAISCQNEQLKYWRMVNLPFQAKWSSRDRPSNSKSTDQPDLIASMNSVEKDRAAPVHKKRDKAAHFPTPDVVAIQMERHKLQADENNNNHQQKSNKPRKSRGQHNVLVDGREAELSEQSPLPPPLFPRFDFEGEDLENRARVRRRDRLYGQSELEPHEEYEVVSPDPDYHRKQIRSLHLEGISSQLRQTRKHRKKILSDSERIQKLQQRLDIDFAGRAQQCQLVLSAPLHPSACHYYSSGRRAASLTGYPPLPPSIASARRNNANVPRLPLHSGRYTAPVSMDRDPSPFFPTPRDRSVGERERRSPFFTTAPAQRRPVSFNLPANSQQLLSAIKQNYPFLLGLAHQLLQNPDKSRLIESFLGAFERRSQLVEQKLCRLEQNVRNAMGDRRGNLIVEITNASRQLKQYLSLADDLRMLLESPECQSNHHQGVKNHGHGTGQASSLNQIRLLQCVFER